MQRRSGSRRIRDGWCIWLCMSKAFYCILFLVSLYLFSVYSVSTRYDSDAILRKQKLSINSANILLSSAIKKTADDGWEIPVWSAAVPPGESLCRYWTRFVATNGQEIEMCVHSANDLVSNHIRQKGRWDDCDELTSLWESSYEAGSIYMEIGANIGACIFQMLLTTNASILAFEPQTQNSLCITSTLRKLKKGYQDRVVLFPVALGSQTKRTIIYSSSDNMGHSFLGTEKEALSVPVPVKTFRGNIMNSSIIPVETPKDVLSADGPRISLLKIDVEGFECNVVDGLQDGNILKKIKTVKYEHGWACKHLIKKFMDAGFQNYYKNEIFIKNDSFSSWVYITFC